MPNNKSIKAVITDPNYDPLFDHEDGARFQKAIGLSVLWYLRRLEEAKKDIAAGRLRTLDPETRLHWRKLFKDKLLKALKRWGIYHAIIHVGRCIYLVHRYKDDHLSIYRIEPAVPTLSDFDDEPPETGMHTPLSANG